MELRRAEFLFFVGMLIEDNAYCDDPVTKLQVELNVHSSLFVLYQDG